MEWFNSFLVLNLIGICTNFDNTSVGFAYGLKNIRFPHWVNLIVNFIGFCTAILGSYLGTYISEFISSKEAVWVSFCILCGIGIFIIYGRYAPDIFRKHREIKIQQPGFRHGVLLGFALSFSNIVTGFGVTIVNHSFIWSIAISISVWGYLAIWFGNKIGNATIFKFLNKYSSLVSGLLIIMVAFRQLL